MKLVCLVLVAAGLWAQAPVFDVASVKASQSTRNGSSIMNNPGRFQTENTTLARLIAFALPAQDFQVVGGPGWIRDARWDIVASFERAEGDTKDQKERILRIRERVMQLLVERFGLELRQEEREMPVYSLGVDKGGSKMKSAEPLGNTNMNGGAAGSTLTGKGMTMARLAETLSGVAKRPVLDETGLAGAFDLELRYSLDMETPEGGAAPKDVTEFPALFTAVKEQLGLRLTGRKGSAPVWVVVKAEKPGEN